MQMRKLTRSQHPNSLKMARRVCCGGLAGGERTGNRVSHVNVNFVHKNCPALTAVFVMNNSAVLFISVLLLSLLVNVAVERPLKVIFLEFLLNGSFRYFGVPDPAVDPYGYAIRLVFSANW